MVALPGATALKKTDDELSEVFAESIPARATFHGAVA
jgi:hypothetical protein